MCISSLWTACSVGCGKDQAPAVGRAGRSPRAACSVRGRPNPTPPVLVFKASSMLRGRFFRRRVARGFFGGPFRHMRRDVEITGAQLLCRFSNAFLSRGAARSRSGLKSALPLPSAPKRERWQCRIRSTRSFCHLGCGRLGFFIPEGMRLFSAPLFCLHPLRHIEEFIQSSQSTGG